MLSIGIGDRRWTSSNTKVRRVRSDECDLSARSRQAFDRGGNVIRQAGKIVRVQQRDAAVDVEAVDQEVRRAPVVHPGAVAIEDKAIVFDRGFRTDPADDAEGFHDGRIMRAAPAGGRGADAQAGALTRRRELRGGLRIG